LHFTGLGPLLISSHFTTSDYAQLETLSGFVSFAVTLVMNGHFSNRRLKVSSSRSAAPFSPHLSKKLCLLLVDVLLAAQHDNPEKQDRQRRTYDSNSGSVHRSISFPDKNKFGLLSKNL
jgi:hypothetical protein